MTSRYNIALSSANQDIKQICETICESQREIFATKAGSDEVRKDPAVRILVHHLATALRTDEFETSVSAYSEASYLCRLHSNTDRIYRDGISAQDGAVNVGALSSSVVRHVDSLSATMAEENIRKHAGLRLIAHQMAFLCNVNQLSKDELDGLIQTCRAQASLTVVADQSVNAGAVTRAAQQRP